MRLAIGLMIGGLILGLLGGFAWRTFAYKEGSSAVDQEYADQISTARAQGTSVPAAGTGVTGGDATTTPVVGLVVITPTPAPPTATPTLEPAPPPLNYSGAGNQQQVFRYTRGPAVFELSHDGAQPFQVRLLDTQGQALTTLASGVGPWDGTRAVMLPEEGDYTLDITGDGAWTVNVMRPDPAVAEISELPYSAEGSGYQALYLIAVPPGLHRLSATHDGSGGFRVRAISLQTGIVDLVVSQDGAFDGSAALIPTAQPDDWVLLDIVADGSWTIEIEPAT